MNWKEWLCWTLLAFAIVGYAADHPEASALLFLAGAVVFWGKRIELAIKASNAKKLDT